MGGGCEISRPSGASASTGKTSHHEFAEAQLAVERARVSDLHDQLNTNAADAVIAKQRAAQETMVREEEREQERVRYEGILCRLRKLESTLTSQQ